MPFWACIRDRFFQQFWQRFAEIFQAAFGGSLCIAFRSFVTTCVKTGATI